MRRGGCVFAGLAAAVVFALAVLGTGQAAGTIIEVFTTRLFGTFIESLPFLLLGALVAGLIDSFLTADDIARVVPRNPLLATITGAFLGFAFPVCEYGVIPVARRLFSKGLPICAGIAFLLAAPVINPIVLVSTYMAFGFGPVLMGRITFTILVAVGSGLVFLLGARRDDVLQPRLLMPVVGGSGDLPQPFVPRKTLVIGMRDALRSAISEFLEIGRYLVIGCLLVTSVQTLVTQDVLLALGRGPILSVLVMQAVAFVLSVGSTVDSLLARSFLGTFTTGSIITFLTFGPMIDLKSTFLLLGVFRTRTVLYLILLTLLMTLLIGVWLNLNVVF